VNSKLGQTNSRLFGEADIIGVTKSSREYDHVRRSEGVMGNITQNGPEDDPDNGGQTESRKTSG